MGKRNRERIARIEAGTEMPLSVTKTSPKGETVKPYLTLPGLSARARLLGLKAPNQKRLV